MPILEFNEPAQETMSVELNRLTVIKLQLYAAWIDATPDQVVNEALQFVFREDNSFQNFLITDRASEIHSHLQEHAIRQIELRNKEFAEFLANDSDRTDDSPRNFRVTLCASEDEAEHKRRA